MRNPVLLAGAAVTALAIGAFAVIALTGDGPRPTASTTQAATGADGAPTQEAAPGGAPAAAAGAAPGPTWTPPAAPRQEPLPPPPKDSWSAVRIVGRPQEAGALGVAVAQNLSELQQRVAPCFDRRAASGSGAVTTVDYAPADDTGTPVLMLQLESSYDQVRVADAPVEARGGASDGLLACAQGAVRGQVVAAQGASPGTRFRMRFMLQP